MYRLGVITLFVGIFAAACCAAWLAGISKRSWAPGAAFWAVLLGLGFIAAACGVQFGADD